MSVNEEHVSKRSTLFWYLIKKLYKTFIIIFAALITILAIANLLARFSNSLSLDLVGIIFFTFLPFMALFAFPLAMICAYHLTLYDLQINNELYLLFNTRRSRNLLVFLSLLFSLISTVIFAPLSFYVAPQCYAFGKKMLIAAAGKTINSLSADCMHQPLQGISFYFKKKEVGGEHIDFKNVLILLHKENNTIIFYGNSAFLYNEKIYMNQGSIYFCSQHAIQKGTFKQAILSLDKMVDSGLSSSGISSNTKTLTLRQLIRAQPGSLSAFELHKKIAQLLHIFLLPFLILLSYLFIDGGNRRYGLSAVFAVSILLFSLFYTGQIIGLLVYPKHILLAYSAVYGILPLFVVLLYAGALHRKSW